MTIFKKTLAALLALVLALACAACGGNAEETAPTAAETAAPAVTEAHAEETTLPDVTIPAPKPDAEIATPYGTLYFPGDWAGFLVTNAVEGETYTVNFLCRLESGREVPMFSITFGGKMEDAIGAVQVDGQLVAVSVETPEFAPDETFTDSEINIVYNMISCLNPVLEAMNLQEAVIEPATTQPQETTPAATQPQEGRPGSSTLPPEMQGDMAIDTPYGELHYPVKWADYLTVEVTEGDAYSVAFFCALEGHEPALLFTVHFGGTQGAVVTKVASRDGGNVEVRVSLTELDLDDSWIDNDVGIAYSMQEDVNYLLSAITG